MIEAIRSLCVRYPRKHATLMSFLATMLRDDGGFEYKKSIVDTIIAIIDENPDAKEAGCNFCFEKYVTKSKSSESLRRDTLCWHVFTNASFMADC